MVQPAVRILTAEQAYAAARALETPAEVRQFEAMRAESSAVRAFLNTAEWSAISTRIMGNGQPPTGRPKSLGDVSRFLRWTAGGELGGEVTDDSRRAYLHAALEVETFARRQVQSAPVSPAGAAAAPVSPAPASPSGLVGFAEALRAVQEGAHISRASWPAGSYVTAQAGYPQGIAVNANMARATWLAEGSTVAFSPYLALVTGEAPEVEPWAPGQRDLFAADWRIAFRR